MVVTSFFSIVRKDMLGKGSGLNLTFVATSNSLSPLSYEMSARSHPAMNSANDLEKLAGPREAPRPARKQPAVDADEPAPGGQPPGTIR